VKRPARVRATSIDPLSISTETAATDGSGTASATYPGLNRFG
jgi:hypothetical protein